jgi:hypothetical protein
MIKKKIYSTIKRKEIIIITIALKTRGKKMMKKKLQQQWKTRR